MAIRRADLQMIPRRLFGPQGGRSPGLDRPAHDDTSAPGTPNLGASFFGRRRPCRAC